MDVKNNWRDITTEDTLGAVVGGDDANDEAEALAAYFEGDFLKRRKRASGPAPTILQSNYWEFAEHPSVRVGRGEAQTMRVSA